MPPSFGSSLMMSIARILRPAVVPPTKRILPGLQLLLAPRFIAWCPPSRVKYYCPPRGALVNSAALDFPASIPEDAASNLRQSPVTHERAVGLTAQYPGISRSVICEGRPR